MADKQSFLSKQGLALYNSRLMKNIKEKFSRALSPATESKMGLMKLSDLPCYTSPREQKFSGALVTGEPSEGEVISSLSFLSEDIDGNEVTLESVLSEVTFPKYTVILDGKTYEHMEINASKNESESLDPDPGTPSYIQFVLINTNGDLVVLWNSTPSCGFYVHADGDTDSGVSHQVEIYKEVEIVHKLDSKYLSWDLIPDKPFGVTKVPRDIVHISNSEDNGLYMIDPSDIVVIDPPYVDSSSVWDSVGGDEPYLWAGEDDTNDAWTTSPHMDFSGILDDPADFRNLKFKVTYDGTTEILPVEVMLDRHGDEDYYYIGQPDYVYNPETETSEYGGLVYPFQIKPFFGDSYSSSVGDESSDIRFRIYVKSGALHDVTVSIMVDGIKKIDSKYLPDEEPISDSTINALFAVQEVLGD